MGMMVGDPSGAYMMQGTMYDPSCYGAYANNGAYMGGYGGYDYGMVQGGYGTATMMDPSQAMMMGGVATEWDHPAPVQPVVQETEEEKRKREGKRVFGIPLLTFYRASLPTTAPFLFSISFDCSGHYVRAAESAGSTEKTARRL